MCLPEFLKARLPFLQSPLNHDWQLFNIPIVHEPKAYIDHIDGWLVDLQNGIDFSSSFGNRLETGN